MLPIISQLSKYLTTATKVNRQCMIWKSWTKRKTSYNMRHGKKVPGMVLAAAAAVVAVEWRQNHERKQQYTRSTINIMGYLRTENTLLYAWTCVGFSCRIFSGIRSWWRLVRGENTVSQRFVQIPKVPETYAAFTSNSYAQCFVKNHAKAKCTVAVNRHVECTLLRKIKK